MSIYTRESGLKAIGLSPEFEHSLSDRAIAWNHHWRQAKRDKDEAKLNQLRVLAPKLGIETDSL